MEWWKRLTDTDVEAGTEEDDEWTLENEGTREDLNKGDQKWSRLTAILKEGHEGKPWLSRVNLGQIDVDIFAQYCTTERETFLV